MSNEINILFEDEDIIAVDKPEGLASISESDTKIQTLHSILEKKVNHKFFIVHRLDKEVSGVILFAKNAKAHKLLNKQFNDRTINKTYIALVHGDVINGNGVIDKPIREFGSGRMGIDEKKGIQSETKFKVLERLSEYSLLELNPATGRRHQLRVHLYSIGYPIVGDMKYGDKSIQEKFSRIMLHAHKLVLQNSDGKNLIIQSPLPDSFLELINELKIKKENDYE